MEKKTKAVNAYLIKNSKGEEGGEREKKWVGEWGWGAMSGTGRGVGVGGRNSHKQSEGLGGVLWVYKIGLK